MRIFRSLVVALVMVVFGSGSAQAALISMNDGVYGAGSITRDTVTGFDWLDLTKSTNFSVNDVLGGAGGFLANGFQIATLAQVEAMYTSGGWDGVDDSANAGSVGHAAFVQSMHNLFGVTGGGNAPFNEGWALSPVANIVSRPFNTFDGVLGVLRAQPPGSTRSRRPSTTLLRVGWTTTRITTSSALG